MKQCQKCLIEFETLFVLKILKSLNTMSVFVLPENKVTCIAK